MLLDMSPQTLTLSLAPFNKLDIPHKLFNSLKTETG